MMTSRGSWILRSAPAYAVLAMWLGLLGAEAAQGQGQARPAERRESQPQQPAPPPADGAARVTREIHVLRVELLSPPPMPQEEGVAGGPMPGVMVLVDGEALSPDQADFLMRIIGQLRGNVLGMQPGVQVDGARAQRRWSPEEVEAREDRAGEGRMVFREQRRDRGSEGEFEIRDEGGPGENWFAPEMGAGALDDETIKNILVVINDVNPTLQTQLVALRETDRVLFEDRMRQSAVQWRELIAMRLNDPEGYRLGVEKVRLIHEQLELSRAYMKASREEDEAKKSEIRERLREVLGKQFDNSTARSEREIKRLADQLEQLRQQVALREGSRESTIDRQLERVTTPRFRPGMRPGGERPTAPTDQQHEEKRSEEGAPATEDDGG